MTREEQVRAELIREVVRKTLNQLLDEEYGEVIKEIEDGKSRMSMRIMNGIIDESQSLKKEVKNEEAQNDAGL